MKNVTITLDEQTAAWAREEAARQGLSLSRLVGEMLHQRMQSSRRYDQAMRRYLSQAPVPLKPADARYPTRDALYDR